MTTFVEFEEINEHEGERWKFWLQFDGNEAEIAKLEQLLSNPEIEGYELSYIHLEEHEVDVLVEHGGWGYMNNHNKVKGEFVCPDYESDHDGMGVQEFCDTMFYKGRIEHWFKE